MIPYEFYKVFHIVSLFLFVASGAIAFFANENPKWNKILLGVWTFFILVGGMGLLARIGVSHTGGWPTWAILKVVVWLIVGALFPILSKRNVPKVPVFYSLIGIMTLAAILAVYKPFAS